MKPQPILQQERSAVDVSEVSDTEILAEYVKRFTIQAGESIRSAKDAASHFRAFFSDASKKEKFVVIFLNGQHQVLTTEVLFAGSLTTSAVYPREVITRVIELGSAAIVIAHNHPSGLTTPSSSDRAVTKKLQTALEAIDVEMLDHIIIGGSEHYSFADNRLL
ncbi:MAG: DNA repair protein RadC [Candidatus Marinimicrobia bacterium]|nr:DNA repair protein RadC [Candidatus Neomarinimicrobiota bacterium]